MTEPQRSDEFPDVEIAGKTYTVSEHPRGQQIGGGFLDVPAATRGDAADFVDRLVDAVEQYHAVVAGSEVFRRVPAPSPLRTLSRLLPLVLDVDVTVTDSGVLDESGATPSELVALVESTLGDDEWLRRQIVDAMIETAGEPSNHDGGN